MITKEELVRIKQGDGLVVESNGIRHYNASEVLINGHSLTEVLEAAAAYKEEQPKVLDADGIEIKPGDELYYKDKKPFIDGKFAGIAKELHTDECPNPWEGNRPWVRYEEGGAEIQALGTEKEAAEAWNTRAERTCRVVPMDAAGKPPYRKGDLILNELTDGCSKCGYPFDTLNHGVPNYCSNCGAKVIHDANV